MDIKKCNIMMKSGLCPKNMFTILRAIVNGIGRAYVIV